MLSTTWRAARTGRPLLRLAPLAAVLSLALGAAPALAATDLLEAYRNARGHDPRMRAADHALEAGREKAVQGAALLRPHVELSAGATYMDDRSASTLPSALAAQLPGDTRGDVRNVAIQLRQPLYNARAKAEQRQSVQQTEMAALHHRHVEQDLMQRVAEAYFRLLLARESAQLVQAEKRAVRGQLDRAQARFDIGRGRITEVQEAQARYDGVLAREVSADSQLALRSAQFEELTGRASADVLTLREDARPLPPAPADLQAWQARAEQQSLRIASAATDVEIARLEIDKHRLSARPTVELVAGWSSRTQGGSLSSAYAPDSQRVATLGARLSIPLFAGGALDSRLRESSARHEQSRQDLQATRRDTRLAVQDGYLAVATGVARVAAMEQSVRSAHTALEAAIAGRDVGTRNDVDVLDAQQRHFGAWLELAQARTDYLLGRLKLAAAAGTLDADELAQLNAFLKK